MEINSMSLAMFFSPSLLVIKKLPNHLFFKIINSNFSNWKNDDLY